MNSMAVRERIQTPGHQLLDLYQADGFVAQRKTTEEYCGPCPKCGGEDRFIIWPDKPQWWCRQCEAKGDLPGYLMTFHGLSHNDALTRLGLEPTTKKLIQVAPDKQKWEPISPIPDNAGRAQPHPKLGEPNDVWTYLDAAGDRLFHVCRFDEPGKGKKVLPLTYCQGPGGRSAWRWKAFPEPRPLYNLDKLGALPAAEVLVVEGEKTAVAAQRIFPDLVCTTSSGGSKAAGKSDWSVLQGRDVIIWPDADEPGHKYAVQVARLARAAGADSIRVVDLPDGLPNGWDLADSTPEDWNQDIVRNLISTAQNWKSTNVEFASDDWPEPIPFENYQAPPLPVEVFPSWAQDFTLAAAEQLQVDSSLVGANVLGAVSVAVANKLAIRIKPNYQEPLNLYIIAPAPPAERKTPTQKLAMAPLYRWEADQFRLMADDIRDAKSRRESQKSVVSGRRSKLKRCKPEDRQPLMDEIAKLERELVDIPSPPRLLADDITPESTAVLMDQNEERLGIASCEGGFFDTLAGRYSGGMPNLDLVLKAHAAEPVRVDRKGDSEPVIMNSPALTICLSPQPEVLKGLMGKPGFRGRGLLGRFIYVLPDSKLGCRDVDTQDMPESIRWAYHNALNTLLDLPCASDDRGAANINILELSREAYQAWVEFAQFIEPELGDGGKFESIRDWAGKLSGLAARLAGILHTMEHLGDAPHLALSPTTMEAGLELASSLSGHALAAFGMMGADPNIEMAKFAGRWIGLSGVERFSQRDCQRAIRSRYPKADQARGALSILEERGYIRREPKPEVKQRGQQPSPVYLVNPKAPEAL